MTQLAPASFACRLVPRPAHKSDQPSNTASCHDPKGAVDAAPPASADGAAFAHFTESGCPVATVPDAMPAKGDALAGMALSPASRFILRLIAAHDGRSEADVLARLIAMEGAAIGLSPLLATAANDIGEDLADLPDFSRRAQTRFAGAREAPRDGFSRRLR